MAIEPPGKISETKIVRREESAAFKQKKKQVRKEQESQENEKSGTIDIKI
jgi:PBP1b-binding outer membrane lipoprotein LpoB